MVEAKETQFVNINIQVLQYCFMYFCASSYYGALLPNCVPPVSLKQELLSSEEFQRRKASC